MQVVSTILAVKERLAIWRKTNQRIALVPTMGHLHQGHLSLIEKARQHADRTVATIYVNPTQFDRIDDLGTYPRTLADDTEQLQKAGVDLLFTPDDSIIYPAGHSNKTRIYIPGTTDILCGIHRSGHFIGVATIVCKLFNMVQPDVAIFGEKDFQQLMIIRKMTADLNIPVEIISAPTWREDGGLAMSSRNSYLTDNQRHQAKFLYQLLCQCAKRVVNKTQRFEDIEADALEQLDQKGFRADYVAIRRATDLNTPTPSDNAVSLVVLLAAYLGKARLIDNLQIRHYLDSGN